MTGPASSVDICNLALIAVGEAPTIQTLELSDPSRDASRLVTILAPLYDQTRRALLCRCQWNFAQAVTNVSRAGDAEDSSDWDSIYTLPSGMLRLNGVGSEFKNPITDYYIQNDLLYLTGDEATVRVWYTLDVTDPQKMRPLFVEALIAELAAKLAFARTKNVVFVREKEVLADTAFIKAACAEAQEQPTKVIVNSPTLTARRDWGVNASSRTPGSSLYD